MTEEKYASILNEPRHRCTTHAPMSIQDRAAQFAPFAALAGHEEGTEEVARATQSQVELSEDAIAHLNRQIQMAEHRLEERPLLTITYFCPDGRKEGGAYHTVEGVLRRIDTHRHVLQLVGGQEIAVHHIVALEGV